MVDATDLKSVDYYSRGGSSPPTPIYLVYTFFKLEINMCICLNCRYIYECQTYEVIELKHSLTKEKIVKESKKNYIPYSPVIMVNSNIKTGDIEWDVIDCLSFQESDGAWILDRVKS